MTSWKSFAKPIGTDFVTLEFSNTRGVLDTDFKDVFTSKVRLIMVFEVYAMLSSLVWYINVFRTNFWDNVYKRVLLCISDGSLFELLFTLTNNAYANNSFFSGYLKNNVYRKNTGQL